MEFVDLTDVDYELIEIKEKENISEYTMDIEVDDTHYYLLENGIVSHNSLSILTQTTSGIEPAFMLKYTRRKKINPSDVNKVSVDFVDKNGDSWHEYDIYHPKLQTWIDITKNEDITKSPWHNNCASDIYWKNRVKLQGGMQAHCDHAISSTLNLPEESTVENIQEIYEAAWEFGCKGITVYRNNCRAGVLVDKKDSKSKMLKFKKSTAPKRPKKLPAEIHHFKIKGENYYVTVGLLENRPYEIFVGCNHKNDESLYIPKNITAGEVQKIKRGIYSLITENSKFIVSGDLFDDNIESLTRMVSVSLRHGTDISFVVQQLEKTHGSLGSFSKALARSLKKYIADGTKVHGELCPNCDSSNLIRQDGCIICMLCGWSKCS